MGQILGTEVWDTPPYNLESSALRGREGELSPPGPESESPCMCLTNIKWGGQLAVGFGYVPDVFVLKPSFIHLIYVCERHVGVCMCVGVSVGMWVRRPEERADIFLYSSPYILRPDLTEARFSNLARLDVQ